MLNKILAVSWTTGPSSSNLVTNSTLSDPNTLVTTILNILTWFIAAAAVAFIIIGGIKYATSGGDEKKVASAKNTILYAVIGLVVALLANVLIRLVLSSLGITSSLFS